MEFDLDVRRWGYGEGDGVSVVEFGSEDWMGNLEFVEVVLESLDGV